MVMLVFGWIIKEQKKRFNIEKSLLSTMRVKMGKIAFLKWKREWNEEKIEIDACSNTFSLLHWPSASLLLKVTFVTFLSIRLEFSLQFSFHLHFLFVLSEIFSYHQEKLLISLLSSFTFQRDANLWRFLLLMEKRVTVITAVYHLNVHR